MELVSLKGMTEQEALAGEPCAKRLPEWKLPPRGNIQRRYDTVRPDHRARTADTNTVDFGIAALFQIGRAHV